MPLGILRKYWSVLKFASNNNSRVAILMTIYISGTLESGYIDSSVNSCITLMEVYYTLLEMNIKALRDKCCSVQFSH